MNQLDELRLDAALATARRCDDRDKEVFVQHMLGHHDAAMALGPQRPFLREAVAIAVGDWAAAAEAADAATDHEAPRRDWLISPHDDEGRCRAAWYRTLAGQPAGRVATPRMGESSCPCSPTRRAPRCRTWCGC